MSKTSNLVESMKKCVDYGFHQESIGNLDAFLAIVKLEYIKSR